MVFDCSLAEVFDAVGRDGSEILWEFMPEPLGRNVIHIDEIKYAALKFNVILAEFLPGLIYNPRGNPSCRHTINLMDQLKGVMDRFDGILLGRFQGLGSHAVAWNAQEGLIYDPAGRLVKSTNFEVDSFHAAIRRGK